MPRPVLAVEDQHAGSLRAAFVGKRLRHVLAQADCLVWEATVRLTPQDWDWRFTVHPSGLCERLFGKRDPMQRVGLWNLFEIPERAEMNRRSRHAIETRAPGYVQEFRAIRDGREIWLRESVAITHSEPGHCWVVGVVMDITERKVADAARSELVARLEKIGSQLPGLIYQFRLRPDGSSCMPYVSEGIREVYGLTPAEVREDARPLFAMLHPDDVASVSVSIARSARDLQPWQCEYRVRRADGAVRWLFGNSVPEREPDGSTLWHGFITDITERKRLDENLAQARDQALEASRLKSEFLATMSHEIRTPMNGVMGMTKLLADTPLTETQADYVRTIETSGESLLTIINDILDYSKIEAGRIDLEVAPFDLRQCIEDALDLFAGAATEKKIELVYLMGPGVPAHVATDATRLRQILVNLLGNALKFTDAGEVVVAVDAEPAAGGHRLIFAVKDTGIGIPPEGMNRLFKSFSQVDASTTRRFGGTGLGLVIARRLAELLGGTMRAESTVGEGSTFHFTIVAEACPHFVQHNLHARQPEVAGARLLVVDDNATNRRVVLELAESWGMSAREAATPHAALELLRVDARCDVVVTDMHMPEMDGEQLAAAIHAQPALARLPLVLLTSLGRRSSSAHFAQVLSKPVRAAALFGAIRACLGTPTGAGGRGVPAAPAYDATLGRRYPLRVLVAEDNTVNQKVVNLLLQRLGYRATTVANGLEVVAALEIKECDVILMDVEMPELDGCEATRRIRAGRNGSGRPWIIALTASVMQGDRERALSAGMNDFLTKPLRTEALTEALIRAHGALAALAAKE